MIPQPTEEMWKLLSEILDGEKLPDTLNNAIYALCDGKLKLSSIDELSVLRPRNWTTQMINAWHLAIPNLDKAFDDLIQAYYNK